MGKRKIRNSRSMMVIISLMLTASIFSVALAADTIQYLPIVFNGPIATQPVEQPDVYIPENHTYFVDSVGYLHVVGEVQNNSDDYLQFIKVNLNIYSLDGSLLDIVTTYTYIDNLPPYTRTCFDALLPEPEGWSYYEFEELDYWTDGSPLPNLTVINDSGSYDPTFGWYEIIGQVRNDSYNRVEYVNPIGTLYNAANDVIGCDFTYVNSTHLEPGEISSFEIFFLGRDYYDVTHYRIQVDGNIQ